MIVLGIETSCDETAVAVSKDYTILHSEVSTQTIHRKFGGVVPEIASREHEKLLNYMVDHTLNKIKISMSEINGIAVTQGPGLAGTLITGICFAKGLAQGLNCKINSSPISLLNLFIKKGMSKNFTFQPVMISGL